MNELKPPSAQPPHHHGRRPEPFEHDISEEQGLPTDASDVEGHTLIDELRESPALSHPKAG